MTQMMNLLEDYLTFRRHRHLRLDGSTTIAERRDMVAAFQSNPGIFVFLLSTRAGGLGINLTAADVVIFYESDWNPTMDLQVSCGCMVVSILFSISQVCARAWVAWGRSPWIGVDQWGEVLGVGLAERNVTTAMHTVRCYSCSWPHNNIVNVWPSCQRSHPERYVHAAESLPSPPNTHTPPTRRPWTGVTVWARPNQ